jgi:hypothetical protein
VSVGLELGAASPAIVWRAPGTHQALALHGDDVWFWTFASPEPRWADVAGTFRIAATPDERAALTALRAGDDADGLTLLLTVAGRTARVAAGSVMGRQVGAAVTPLLERLRAAPVAAVAVRAAVVAPPGGLPAMLGLTVDSIGTEPAVLGLAAEAVRLGAADGAWRPVPAPRMGLVDGTGTLLDGLYAAATVPAGGRGAWVLPGVTASGVHEMRAQCVRIGGTIRVAGPVPPAMVAFEATAPLTRPGQQPDAAR